MIGLPLVQEAVLALCGPSDPVEVPAGRAIGCVSASDVVSGVSVPPFDNSAVDGYAVRRGDIPAVPAALPVQAAVLAGSPGEAALWPGHACKVMTGAPVPAGAECVVMVEETEPGAGDRVIVRAIPGAGSRLRRRGSDVAAGDVVLPVGTPIRPGVVAALASIGRRSVLVHRRPRVGVAATGDELVTEPRALRAGEIYECAADMLAALVRGAGGVAISLGVIPDEPGVLGETLAAAAAQCDLIVTTGGVSMGDADFLPDVLASLGSVRRFQVAIRPGKPFALGLIGGTTPVLGLPGNPVSSLVTFELLVRPAVRALLGDPRPIPIPVRAVAAEPLDATDCPDRVSYLRVITDVVDGSLSVRPVAGQSSHQIFRAASADGLAVVPMGARIDVGAGVDVLAL
ncbi:MAG: molybdopterin molybdotransferase MoeA [Mycobacteriales bacterium]